MKSMQGTNAIMICKWSLTSNRLNMQKNDQGPILYAHIFV
jgi:hypothetical protein